MLKSPISIYLMKNVSDFRECLRKSGSTDGMDIFFENSDMAIYGKSTKSNPDWVKFLKKEIEGKWEKNTEINKLKNMSSFGVVILKRDPEVFFCIPFGQGFHFLNDSKIDRSFGLRVAINLCEEDSIKMINLLEPENHAQKVLKESPVHLNQKDFYIDEFRSILKGISIKLPKNENTNFYEIRGVTADNKFPLGQSMAGRDSVKMSKRVASIRDLESKCDLLNGISQLTIYRENNFEWIDYFYPLSKHDKEIKDLDSELLMSFMGGNWDQYM